MKKNISIIALMLCLTLTLTACGSAPPSDNKDVTVYHWDYMEIVSTENAIGSMAVDFADEVRERTGGQLDITVRPTGELPFTTDEYLRAAADGSVQMSACLLSAISGDLEAGSLPGLPFLVSDADELEKSVQALRPMIEKELTDYNTTMLYYYSWPPQVLFGSGEPISNMDGVKGLTLRAQGAEQSEWLSMNGAFPVSISAGDFMTSLTKGLVEGAITAGLTCYTSKWYESLDWGYLIPTQSIPTYVVVNNDALNELPDDVKNTLLEVCEEYIYSMPEKITTINDEALISMEDEGMEMIYPSEEDISKQINMMQEYWDNWAIKKGGHAVEGLSIIKETLDK